MAKITALELLRQAAKRGWIFRVICEGAVDYEGTSAIKAWNAVKATGEANVVFCDTDLTDTLGSACLMAPGPMTCEPDETLIDYTTRGEFGKLCDQIMQDS